MKRLFPFFFAIGAVIMAGCAKDDDDLAAKFVFDFESDSQGWVGGFADYPNDPDVENFYEFQFSHASLPAPLNANEKALMQSGNNHSDDLFMFVKKKVGGLKPNGSYTVCIEIEIATNAPTGSVGVGGAPGESVGLKGGASAIEPLGVVDSYDNHYRMNIDKGNQSVDGVNMKNMGNFANGTNEEVYKLKKLKTSTAVSVQSNADGEFWLIVGTDSGYEATTTIYYNSIIATIR